MSIQVSWLVEGQVVYWKSSGVDTYDDLIGAEDKVVSMFDESAVPLVHTIMDFSDLDQIPQVDFTEDRKIPKHPKNGWGIFVAMENPLQKMLAAIKGGQSKARIRWFATMQEAAEFLQSVDSTLPDLTPIIEDLEGTT